MNQELTKHHKTNQKHIKTKKHENESKQIKNKKKNMK